jgi:hypothetical protein
MGGNPGVSFEVNGSAGAVLHGKRSSKSKRTADWVLQKRKIERLRENTRSE